MTTQFCQRRPVSSKDLWPRPAAAERRTAPREGWIIRALGHDLGPLDWPDVVKMVRDGLLCADDSVRSCTSPKWHKLHAARPVALTDVSPAQIFRARSLTYRLLEGTDARALNYDALRERVANGQIQPTDQLLIESNRQEISAGSVAALFLGMDITQERDAEPPDEPTQTLPKSPRREAWADIEAEFLESQPQGLPPVSMKSPQKPSPPRPAPAKVAPQSPLAQRCSTPRPVPQVPAPTRRGIPRSAQWLVACSLVFAAVWWLIPNPDARDATALRRIYAEFVEKRRGPTNAEEWSAFQAQASAQLDPIIQRLEREATSKSPRRRALLFAGRDYLRPMVCGANFRHLAPGGLEIESEQRFRQNMATYAGTSLTSTELLAPAQGEGPVLNPFFSDPTRRL